MDFLEKLDLLMKKNNLNKHSLSEESGVPYTTIVGFYKKGYDNIRLPTMQKLAQYFNTTLDYLMTDDICDVNYRKSESVFLKDSEMSIIEKYRTIDERGKELVDMVLDKEYECAVAHGFSKEVSITNPEQIRNIAAAVEKVKRDGQEIDGDDIY